MNGKRILNELIAIFIFLNIALFTFNVLKTVASYRLNESRINNVKYALEQKQIYLETQLPRNFTPKAQASLSHIISDSTTVERYNIVSALFGKQNGNITVSKENNEADIITHKFGNEALEFGTRIVTYTNSAVPDKGTHTTNIQEAKKVCRAFIRRLNYSKVFFNAHIQYNENENGLEMTFYGKYKNLPVFDMYITFQIVDGQIKKAVMHLGKVTKLEDSINVKAIYPIDLVLFSIDDDLDLEKPIYITNIILGYKTLDKRNMTFLDAQLIPVYKIEVKGLNSPIYVNAYTNKRIE